MDNDQLVSSSRLAEFVNQRVSWTGTEAPGEIRRAVVEVPIDYRNPDAGPVPVALARHSATSSGDRIGTLVIAPDDPGSSGIALLPSLVAGLPPEVVARYDLVAFDHRFSGDSAPMSFGLDQDEIFWVFHKPTSFEKEVRFQSTIAAKAADSAISTLPHVTSRNIARDIDVVRQVLGEERISFLGYSYGSYLGAVYAEMFGAHVEHAVLDSVISPDWVWRQLFLTFAKSCEGALNRWSKWMADTDRQLGGASGDVRDAVFDLVAKAGGEPIQLAGLPMPLGQPLIRMIVMLLLSSADHDALLADFLDAALTSREPEQATIGTLMQFFGQPRDDATAAAQLAILCGDWAWPRELSGYERDMASWGEKYPFMGSALAGVKAGAFWPVQPFEPPTEIGRRSAGSSVLLVQAGEDMFTPPGGAHRMRELLPDARLITVSGLASHQVFPYREHVGANELVSRFLLTGRAPTADVTCRDVRG